MMLNRKVSSVLFVCMGNICRSPTAEAVFRAKAKQAGLTISIDSAGTIGYHQGAQPDERSRQAGEKRGLDFSGITARRIEDNDFEKFDLILAADRQNFQDLKQRCPSHLEYKLGMMLAFGPQNDHEVREVPDPYYGGEHGFELVLDLLEQSCEGLAVELNKNQ